MRRWTVFALIALSGCFQAYDAEDDLRTTPVTNNPHVIPNYGNGMPGFGGSGQSPS